MRMNAGIILAGQPVNALGRLREGIQTAGIANEVGDQNRLRDVFSTQGAGIMQGDQGALEALATAGPQGGQMALGVRQQQQEMEIQRERLSMARQAAAQQAAQFAAGLGEVERQRVVQALSTQAPRAVRAAQQGDVAGFNAIVDPYREVLGFGPAQDEQEMLLQLAAISGMSEGFAGVVEAGGIGQGPQLEGAALTRHQQAIAGELEPGSPEYRHFMLTGERMPDPNAAAPVDTGAQDSLRGDFSNERGVKEFQDQATAFERLRSTVNSPPGPGDLAMIFNFMKILDPGAAIMRDDFENASNAAAWLESQGERSVPRPVAQAIRTLESGGILSDQARVDFLSTAAEIYRASEQNYNRTLAQYSDMASRRGMNPDETFIDYRLPMPLVPMPMTPRGQAPTFAPPPGAGTGAPQTGGAGAPTTGERARNAGGVTTGGGVDFSQVSDAELAAMPAPNRDEDPEGYAAYLAELRRRAAELTNGGR